MRKIRQLAMRRGIALVLSMMFLAVFATLAVGM